MNEANEVTEGTEKSKTTGPDELQYAVRELKALGRTWAGYGLNAGKAALETSAFTLRSTADFLGHVKNYIDDTVLAECEERAEPVEAAPAEETAADEEPSEAEAAAEEAYEKPSGEVEDGPAPSEEDRSPKPE